MKRFHYRELSIRKKILMVFVICTGLIFASLIAYIQFVIRPRNVADIQYTISQTVEGKASEVGMWITSKAVEFRTIAAIPAFSSMDVREIAPMIERFTDLYRYNGKDMETFSYIGKNGFCWINSAATEDLMENEFYTLAYSDEREFVIGRPVLGANNRRVMLFYYPVIGYSGDKEALICSAVPAVRLEEIVNTLQIFQGKTFVMNQLGQILTSNEEYFYDHYLSKETLKLIPAINAGSPEIIFTTDVNGKAATLFITAVGSYPDWLYCTLVSDSVIHQSTNEMLLGCILLLLALMILVFAIGVFLTRSVLHPVKKLQECMYRVEKGDVKAYYNVDANRDEIYALGMSYNSMLDEISRLIEHIYFEQGQKRSAELRVLQEQIKPHFLYNTLDNLRYMALEHDAEDVAEAITSLSSFFRIFLSGGQERISLKQEFRHTRDYLDIQSIRYQERLRFTMQLDEDVKEVQVPKIIIQPLVENALYHGIKNKSGGGEIAIRAWRDQNTVKITVEDDGAGMDPDSLSFLQQALQRDENGEHFGLINIQRRLQATYGALSRMDIESEQGIFTRVTIIILVSEEQ